VGVPADTCAGTVERREVTMSLVSRRGENGASMRASKGDAKIELSSG